jgi:hypothetical protein
MLYILTMCYDPGQPLSPERRNLQPEHAKLEAELRAEGTYVSGAACWPAAQSKIVRRGEPTDGASIATNEAVGGYYLVECDEAQALKIAARIPVDESSWVRVQAIALFHPDAERIAAFAGYVDPRLRGVTQPV